VASFPAHIQIYFVHLHSHPNRMDTKQWNSKIMFHHHYLVLIFNIGTIDRDPHSLHQFRKINLQHYKHK
jgi:hypothetical protein